MLECVNEIPMDTAFNFLPSFFSFSVVIKFIHCFAHFVLRRLEKDKLMLLLLLFFFSGSLCQLNEMDLTPSTKTSTIFQLSIFHIIFMSLQDRIIIIIIEAVFFLFGSIIIIDSPKDGDEDVSGDRGWKRPEKKNIKYPMCHQIVSKCKYEKWITFNICIMYTCYVRTIQGILTYCTQTHIKINYFEFVSANRQQKAPLRW